MLLKLKLLSVNLSLATLLLFFLCLGSQNLDNRYKINLLFNETVELPSGFIIGVSFIFGFLSGGISSTITIKDKDLIEK